jgi:predicted DNA-binding protein YlxM (UPF0122 family)
MLLFLNNFGGNCFMGAIKDLTIEERKRIALLVSRNVSIREIARIINRSKSCVVQELKRYKETKIYDPVVAHQEAQNRKAHRFDNLMTPYTPEQIRIIEKCVENNLSMSKIKEIIGTSYDKLKKYFIKNNPDYIFPVSKRLEDRISALEMQMEIIVDQLKEINERYSKNH